MIPPRVLPARPRNDAYAALRIPDYRRFLAMRLFTTLAIQIMSVSISYFVYDLTGDPFMLGLIGLTEALPSIAVSLWAGHLADKHNRRNILVACLGLMVLCTSALVVLTWQRDVLPKNVLLGGIYTAIFITGVARGFFSPTNFAFLPQLVDKKTLPNAISWNSSTWEMASLSGLGIGGLLYGFAGVTWACATMAALTVLALLMVLRIASRPAPPADHTVPALVRIREGLHFVFGSQLILGAIALDLFAMLFGGAVALLPVYAKDILHVGPEGLGILRAAMSFGAIIMGLYLAHRPLRRHAGRVMLTCVAGFGICIIGFGLSEWFWLSFLFLFLSGILDEVSVFVRANLVQHLTPDRLKGRVSSVNSIFIVSSNELGAFESGVAAKLFGTVPAVVLGGVLALGVVGFTWWKAPELRRFHFDDGQEE
ncbi:MAG: MFS transporter [Saprospirales bacterium]|nr:MFS transporter [Saprospirales bacterium]